SAFTIGSRCRTSRLRGLTINVATSTVYIVHLRRPQSRRANPNESRADPFWESGSFGCTRCHWRNLMNPRHADELNGARLAFAQGGPHGHRLVFLTPPVNIKIWRDRLEAKWAPQDMPFRYEHAPVLVANNRVSDFPSIEALARDTLRSTAVAGFSS